AELGLFLDDLGFLHGSLARFQHDIGFEVQHRLEFPQGDVEQMADTRGQAFEEPDVRAWRRKLDVSQPFAANFGQRDFHAALVADHAAVLHALVLTAETLPVGDRAENAGAEQAIALRLEGAVVNGFRFGDFTMRPAPDALGRCQADADAVEVGDVIAEVERARTVQSVLRFVSSFRSGMTRKTALWHWKSAECRPGLEPQSESARQTQARKACVT